MTYVRYGIHDWNAHDCGRIRVEIYEGDPGPWRMHDVLISFEIGREESRRGVGFGNDHIPILDLRTVDLPEPDQPAAQSD